MKNLICDTLVLIKACHVERINNNYLKLYQNYLILTFTMYTTNYRFF